ncbi:MAG TPA: DUF1566 domain-containing protein, partial [Methanosarcina vacuolata]|nr:DUF1566 domain-containing protein [Methanosarcina vacuolata]
MSNTIKTKALSLLLFLAVLFTWQYQSAQCTNCTADGPLNSISYSEPAFSPEWTTVQTNAAEGRDYMLFYVVKGQIYRWSTYGIEDNNSGINVPCLNSSECSSGLVCEGLAGSKKCELAFDTELTLLKGSCGSLGQVLAYNRNAVYRNQSQIEWKADFSGTVFLLVNNYKCQTSCDKDGLNCMKTSVKWQRTDSTHCTECQYHYPITAYDAQPAVTVIGDSVSELPVNSPGWTTTANNNLKGGEFQIFHVEKGNVYRWSTCSDTSYDTQLTLFRGEGRGLHCSTSNSFCTKDADCPSNEKCIQSCGDFLAYGDDSETSPCPVGSKQTILEWTADYTGEVTLLNNEYNCGYCNRSPNVSNPWGHCSLTTLGWQRFDCNYCNDLKGPYNPSGTVQYVSNLEHGDYLKFNLKKGVKYRFRSIQKNDSSTFTGMLTLRPSSGTACSGDTLALSKKRAGSHEHELIYTATSDFVAELLVAGADCGNPGSKEAVVSYVELYDPTVRFQNPFNDESSSVPACCNWTGVTLDTQTGLLLIDNNVYKETWNEARNYCNDLNYTIPSVVGNPGTSGQTVDDWSLPNINELYSIVDFDIYDKATSYTLPSYVSANPPDKDCTLLTQESDCVYPKYICGDKRKCVRNNWYWSSTSVDGSTYFSWGVNMIDGRSYMVKKDDNGGIPATKHKVICVRGTSVSGEFDIYRPARERIFSGWACDKDSTNKSVTIYFAVYDADGKNILDIGDFYMGKIEKIPGRSIWGFIYGETDKLPAAGSAKETKINKNCGGTALTVKHAFEVDLKGSSDLAVRIKNKLSGKKAPYYATAYAGNYSTGWKPKSSFVLTPEEEIFVLSDECGDGIRTLGEQCDDGNNFDENCAYNTSCMICTSACKWDKG